MSIIEKHLESHLTPRASLLCKLASIVVHFEEFHAPSGVGLDLFEVLRLLKDPEIVTWLAQMTEAGLAPMKRLESRPRKRRKR